MSKKDLKDRQNAWAIAARDRDDRAAADRLIESMMPMIWGQAGIAGRAYRLEREDFISEGAVGVMRAIKVFDETRGPFSACAFWYIRDSINAYGRENWSHFKVPQSKGERKLHENLSRLVFEYEVQGWSTPRAIEMAAHDLGADPKHAEKAMALRNGRQILSDDAEDGKGLSLIDDGIDGERAALETQAAELIAECMDELTDMERKILSECHLAPDPISFSEFGRREEMTRQRVGKISAAALEKIGAALRAQGYKLEDLV